MGTTTAQNVPRCREWKNTRVLRLPPLTSAPRTAKTFVKQWLWDGDWTDATAAELVDNALIIVSEFATNACCHVKQEFSVIYEVTDGGRPVVAVWDPSLVLPVFPEPVDFSDLADRLAELDVQKLAENNRGLGLVVALAARWGADIWKGPEGGKIVWAEL